MPERRHTLQPHAAAEEKQQFNVYLSPQLVRAVKLLALDRQLSLSDLVRDALEAYIRKHGGRK